MIKKIILIGVVIVPVASIAISFVHTPLFTPHTTLEKDTLSLFPSIDEKFLMLKSPSTTSYPKAYYSYAPIYYNLTTADGWGIPKKDHMEKLKNVQAAIDKEDCTDFNQAAEDLKVTNVIAYKDDCKKLEHCGLESIDRKGDACLYRKNNFQ